MASFILACSTPPVSWIGCIPAYLNVPVTGFTVTPNQIFTGIINLSDANPNIFILSSGLFTPSSLNFSNSVSPQSFTYTPLTPGAKPISINVNGIQASQYIYVNVLPWIQVPQITGG